MKQKEWHEANKRWAYRLWLGDWSMKSCWSREPKEGGGDAHHVAADVQTSPAYKLATITGYEPALKSMTAAEGDKIACHENVHAVLTDWNIFVGDLIASLPKAARPLAERRQDELWETMTTRVTQILTSAVIEWKDGDPRHGGDPIP